MVGEPSPTKRVNGHYWGLLFKGIPETGSSTPSLGHSLLHQQQKAPSKRGLENLSSGTAPFQPSAPNNIVCWSSSGFSLREEEPKKLCVAFLETWGPECDKPLLDFGLGCATHFRANPDFAAQNILKPLLVPLAVPFTCTTFPFLSNPPFWGYRFSRKISRGVSSSFTWPTNRSHHLRGGLVADILSGQISDLGPCGFIRENQEIWLGGFQTLQRHTRMAAGKGKSNSSFQPFKNTIGGFWKTALSQMFSAHFPGKRVTTTWNQCQKTKNLENVSPCAATCAFVGKGVRPKRRAMSPCPRLRLAMEAFHLAKLFLLGARVLTCERLGGSLLWKGGPKSDGGGED